MNNVLYFPKHVIFMIQGASQSTGSFVSGSLFSVTVK